MNQRIVYAQVSTEDQYLDLQRDALQQVGCRVVYEEAASGKKAARQSMSNAARPCTAAIRWWCGAWIVSTAACLTSFQWCSKARCCRVSSLATELNQVE